MNASARISTLRDALLDTLQAAAKKRDVPTVLALQPKLERLATLARKVEEIDREILAFEGGSLANGVQPMAGSDNDDDLELSGKARGRAHRDRVMNQLKKAGVTLEPSKGSIVFRAPSGMRVGIAYAREGDKNNKQSWFLGLPKDGFDHAILLCEDAAGILSHFSLPKDFMQEHDRNLSTSGGQTKFHVRRRDGSFWLNLRAREPVNLEPLRNNFCGLLPA